jgi:hypothetical protein
MEKFSKPNIIYAAAGIFILGAVVFGVMKKGGNSIPANLVLQVPFSPQAPTNNWDRNEDCEETSVTMANAYLTGSTEDRLPAAAAQEAINNLKTWEQAHLGYNANTGADATTQMAEGAFGLNIRQIADYTENDLKTALVNHHPILLPINAKLLGNPKYFDNGPLYHMIVLRGFRGDTFIVNDPGTDGGDGNEYSFATLKNAGADWDQPTKSIDGKEKIALVVYK